MQRIILLIALMVGVATPLVIIIGSIVAVNRASQSRSAVVIRVLIGLGLWAAVSVFTLFVMFVNMYSVAHTDYAYQHGRVNPDDAARVDNFLIAVRAVYIIICGLMGYYYLRLMKRREEHLEGHGAI
jgi:lysylphosphatidylglycerol synthetase-like protein (DUF2156 family)